MRSTLTPLDHYMQTLLPNETPIEKRISEQLMQDQKHGINIGPIEAHLLQWFISVFNIKKVVEIGTQYGFSTYKMLQVLPSDGQVISIEKSPEHHKKAKALNSDPRVQFILGDATEILPSLVGEFDLIFIDANKNGYLQYLDWAMEHVKKGGLIVGDNTFLFGQVFNSVPSPETPTKMWQTMREFNNKLFSSSLFKACIIPTQEGLTVGYKI